jgi:hypothetical protein
MPIPFSRVYVILIFGYGLFGFPLGFSDSHSFELLGRWLAPGWLLAAGCWMAAGWLADGCMAG